MSDLDGLPSRIVAKINVNPATGCWEWTGATMRNGYGMVSWEHPRRARLIHRVVYTLLAGPIPDGLTIDHLCRVRHCCNPAHLEPVTARENLLRGETITAANAAKTHCPQGHEYTPENTYARPDGRQCRRCVFLRDLRRSLTREEAAELVRVLARDVLGRTGDDERARAGQKASS